MQEHQITLVEIRREAMLLELDVDISTGRLDIFKRSDASTGFYSLQDADDPRVLIAAWQFLQFYRIQLDQFDAARRELTNRPLRRLASKAFAVGYRVAVLVLAIGAGVLVALLAGDSLLAIVVSVLILATGGLLRPRRLR